MGTFLKLLNLELQDIKEFVDLGNDPEQSDHVAGVMTDEQKKLYTYYMKLKRQLDESRVTAKYSKDPAASGKVDELEEKVKVTRAIFYFTIREDFALWDKEVVAVCKGHQIVWSTGPPALGLLPPFLRGLFPPPGEEDP